MTFQSEDCWRPGPLYRAGQLPGAVGQRSFWHGVQHRSSIRCRRGVQICPRAQHGAGAQSRALLNNLFRAFLLIPWAIPTVMSALNWRWIYDDASGLINNVLVRLNLVEETISWLSNPQSRHALGDHGRRLAGDAVFYHELSCRPPVHSPRSSTKRQRSTGRQCCNSSATSPYPWLRPVFITAVMLSAILTSSSIHLYYILTNGGPADAP